MPHPLTEEEIEAMRTEEGWKNYVACQLRESGVMRQQVLSRLETGDARMDRMEATQKKNAEAIEGLTTKAQEIFDVVTALKGGKTVLGWAGKVFVWVSGIVVAWASIKSAIHGEIRFPWQ